MSAQIEMNEQVNVEASIIDTKSNAARKPKLSTKLEKQMMFGCWFLQHLVEQGIIADASVFSRARTALKMFESIEVQTEFYETFETAMSATQKTVRKEIADFHKPPKAPKASRAKKADVKAAEGEAEPKRGRKKKVVEVVVDNNKDFIEQLVAVANARSAEQIAAIVAESTSNATDAEPEVTPIITTTNILQVLEATTVDPVKEKKPRKKPEPKAKPVVVEPVTTEVVITTTEVVVTEPVKAAPKKRAAPKKKEAEVIAPVVAEVVVKAAEPVVDVVVKAAETVVAPVVVVKAAEPVAKAPRKKAEPKAKVVDPKVEEAKRIAELRAVEEARILVEKQQYEEARQAAIKAAKEAVDDEDDDRSHHTVKLPDSDDEDEEEEEIHAREFIFNGKQYLIDENSNEVYDYETQEPIGTFDKESNKIIS